MRVLIRTHHVPQQAELQTNSQRVTLADTSPTPQDVVPGQNMDIVISHEVKELGKHTYVVSDFALREMHCKPVLHLPRVLDDTYSACVVGTVWYSLHMCVVQYVVSAVWYS